MKSLMSIKLSLGLLAVLHASILRANLHIEQKDSALVRLIEINGDAIPESTLKMVRDESLQHGIVYVKPEKIQATIVGDRVSTWHFPNFKVSTVTNKIYQYANTQAEYDGFESAKLKKGIRISEKDAGAIAETMTRRLGYNNSEWRISKIRYKKEADKIDNVGDQAEYSVYFERFKDGFYCESAHITCTVNPYSGTVIDWSSNERVLYLPPQQINISANRAQDMVSQYYQHNVQFFSYENLWQARYHYLNKEIPDNLKKQHSLSLYEPGNLMWLPIADKHAIHRLAYQFLICYKNGSGIEPRFTVAVDAETGEIWTIRQRMLMGSLSSTEIKEEIFPKENSPRYVLIEKLRHEVHLSFLLDAIVKGKLHKETPKSAKTQEFTVMFAKEPMNFSWIPEIRLLLWKNKSNTIGIIVPKEESEKIINWIKVKS